MPRTTPPRNITPPPNDGAARNREATTATGAATGDAGPVQTPITGIRNLGPATAAAFGRAGITSAEQVRALGPDAAYRRLLETGTPPHFIGYYVLVMGLQGRPWNDCHGDEKAALRLRFDALSDGFRGKTGARSGRQDTGLPDTGTPQYAAPERGGSHLAGLEAELDALGVIARRA